MKPLATVESSASGQADRNAVPPCPAGLSFADRVVYARSREAIEDPDAEEETILDGDGNPISAVRHPLTLDEAWANIRRLCGMDPIIAPSIGTRTAADLLYGDPPDQLVPPFLTPEGPTVIYGKGGTGKGLLSCYLIQQLVQDGQVVLLVDFEGNEREWGFRLRGLGLTEEQLGRIHYRIPFGQDWTAPTGSLADIANLLRADAVRIGATVVVVDSYTIATSTGDEMGGRVAAQEYFSALQRIGGLPSLTIAHVRGDSERFPERPFGSVFVHNLARETWAVEKVAGSEEETDPDVIIFGPKIVALELRNKKRNSGPKATAQFITFSFYPDHTIEVSREGIGEPTVADLCADALETPLLNLKQIAAAIYEDTGRKVSTDILRLTMERYPGRFVVDRTSRPFKWSNK